VGRVIGHVRNRENRCQQHRENRSAHVATIGALLVTASKHALVVTRCCYLILFFTLCVEMMLYCFDVFVQNSEQFKILLIDGPLIGTAAVEVRQTHMCENMYFILCGFIMVIFFLLLTTHFVILGC